MCLAFNMRQYVAYHKWGFILQTIMPKTNITVVTVSYKSAELTTRSLSSVYQQKQQSPDLNIRAVVVDNASGDSPEISAFIEQQGWSDWATLITAEKNGGFGFGNNLAFRHALKHWDVDFFQLLNPDAEARENCFQPLVNFLLNHPGVGIVGSQILNIDGYIESSAHRFHSPVNELLESARLGALDNLFEEHALHSEIIDEPFQCDWLCGASMMIRREVIDQIGLFDENFFLYFEEVDFFHRASKAGWQTWYVPEAKVTHIEGASTGIKLVRRRPQYWYESRRRMFVKMYGVLGLVAADVLWAVGRMSYLVRRFLKLGAQKPNIDPKWYMYDLLSGDLKSLLTLDAFRLKAEKVD